MEADSRIETLEEEFKLIKGELKQTLASVRDYLIESGLPDSEYTTIMAAMMAGGGGQQKVEMKGNFTMPKEQKPQQEEEIIEEEVVDEFPEEEQPEDKLPEEEQPEDELAEEKQRRDKLTGEKLPEDELTEEEQPEDELDEEEQPEDELAEEEQPEDELAEEELPEDELDEEEQPEGELFSQRKTLDEIPDEEEALAEKLPVNATGLPEQRMERGRFIGEVSQSIPKVDLLANLIRWVSTANAEIGKEQLATFLEVYGISGHLTPELKEVILHLVEMAEPQSAEATKADIWSRLILELHGVLTGGDAPLHPVRPFWNDVGNEVQSSEPEPASKAEAEVEKPKDKPLKLKLVVTDNEGSDREFSLDLSPQEGKASFKDAAGW